MRGATFLSIVATATLLGCGPTGTTRIGGTITYRDKVALPANAVVDVQLDDAAAAKGAPPVLRQIIDTQGRQVPIPFALDVERAALQDDHHYVLRAEIRTAAGEVLFTTPPDEPPITNLNTTGRVELVLASASP
ncbi:MAG TPA: YbaY family lipoprotein [Polyangiales bacterium]|jgi:putative lipoprotein|nr:YbaY family lipoprotein [Polyangiales bacterium]